jgi:hypothetical protein
MVASYRIYFLTPDGEMLRFPEIELLAIGRHPEGDPYERR